MATPAHLSVSLNSTGRRIQGLAYIAADPPGENNWWVAKLYTQVAGRCAKGDSCSCRNRRAAAWLADGRAALVAGRQSRSIYRRPDERQGADRRRSLGSSRPGRRAGESAARRRGGSTGLVRGGPVIGDGFVSGLGQWRVRARSLLSFGNKDEGAAAKMQAGASVFSLPRFGGRRAHGDEPLREATGAILLCLQIQQLQPARRRFGRRGPANCCPVSQQRAGQPDPVDSLETTGSEAGLGQVRVTRLGRATISMCRAGWRCGTPKNYDPGKKYPLIVIVHGGPAAAVTPRWGGGGLGPAMF